MKNRPRDIEGSSAILRLFGIVLAILIVISPHFKDFFSQDDFAGLFVDASNPSEFAEFFKPEPGGERPWYRPLSFQLRFWVMREAFGFNPVPYHILTFLIHSANIFLCYFLLRKLLGRNDISLVGATLYGLNGAHQMSLYWFAAGNEMMAALFLLFGMLAFIRWREKPGFLSALVTGLMFIFSVMSKETGVVFPFLVMLTDCIFPKQGKRNWGIHITLFLILIAYLIFWFTLQYDPAEAHGQGYTLDLSPKGLIVNFTTFLGQAFIGTSILYSVAKKFGSEFGPSGYSSFFTPGVIRIALIVLVVIIAAAYGFLRKSWQNMPNEYRSIIKWGLIWFVIGLLPVLPLTSHNYAYNMNIALIGLAAALAAFVHGLAISGGGGQKWRNIGWFLIAIYFLNFSINYELATYVRTIPLHSKVAKTAYEKLLAKDMDFERGTLLVIMDVNQDLVDATTNGLLYRAMYPDSLRYCFLLKPGDKVTKSYLEKRGWTDERDKVFLSYDDEGYHPKDADYFRLVYLTRD